MRVTLGIFAVLSAAAIGVRVQIVESGASGQQVTQKVVEVATYSLERNQYIASFFNRAFQRSESQKQETRDQIARQKMTFVTPLFCKLKGMWFDVTAAMVEQKEQRPCVKVTCLDDGSVQGELLDSCGDVGRYVHGGYRKQWNEDTPKNLRVLTAYDPMSRTEKGVEAVFSRRGGISVSARTIEENGGWDGNGNVQLPVGLMPEYFLKAAVWDLPVTRCNKLERMGMAKVLPTVTSDDTFQECLSLSADKTTQCETDNQAHLDEGIDYYLKHPKRGTIEVGMITKCEWYDNTNFIENLFSLGKATKKECEDAFQETFESRKADCVRYTNYCEKAYRCFQQMMLPDPAESE